MASQLSYRLVYGASVLVGAYLFFHLLMQPLSGIGAPQQWQVSDSQSGKALFSATGIRPGQMGSGALIMRNAGNQPFMLQLTQDLVINSGFGSNLRLAVYDSSTRRCLYPSNSARRGPCTSTGTWNGARAMGHERILSRTGQIGWQRTEQHRILVTWALLRSSPNSDQGRLASFRLRWRAIALKATKSPRKKGDGWTQIL